MEIAYQHANPEHSHNTTLIEFDTASGRTYRALVDAGPGTVAGLDDDILTTLDAVFLTHAHIDHYRELPAVLDEAPTIPVFVSPQTAAMLPVVFDQRADDMDEAFDIDIDARVQPIDGWTSLFGDLGVLPVPAGHTPGATAFLFRYDDMTANDKTPSLLATGDWTLAGAGPTPGLLDGLPETASPDTVIANMSPGRSQPGEDLAAVVEDAIEGALAGSPVVVGATGLTGVHAAMSIGRVLAETDRACPVRLTGQVAQLYDALAVDQSAIDLEPTFGNPDTLIEAGAITVASPPGAGGETSTGRLVDALGDRPDGLFVQAVADYDDTFHAVDCRLNRHTVSYHPTEEAIDDLVDALEPRQLIPNHTTESELSELEGSYDQLIFFSANAGIHRTLYDTGDFQGPDWLDQTVVSNILRTHYRQSTTTQPLDAPLDALPGADWPAPADQPLPLAAEAPPIQTISDRAAFTTAVGDTEADTGADSDVAADSGADAGAGGDADAEVDAGADGGVEADSGADAGAEADVDAEADAGGEADVGAEANAGAKVDSEQSQPVADGGDAGVDADATDSGSSSPSQPQRPDTTAPGDSRLDAVGADIEEAVRHLAAARDTLDDRATARETRDEAAREATAIRTPDGLLMLEVRADGDAGDGDGDTQPLPSLDHGDTVEVVVRDGGTLLGISDAEASDTETS